MTKHFCQAGHTYESDTDLPTQCPEPECDFVSYPYGLPEHEDTQENIAAKEKILRRIFGAEDA